MPWGLQKFDLIPRSTCKTWVSRAAGVPHGRLPEASADPLFGKTSPEAAPTFLGSCTQRHIAFTELQRVCPTLEGWNGLEFHWEPGKLQGSPGSSLHLFPFFYYRQIIQLVP